MISIETSTTNKNLNFVEYDTSKNWIDGFPTKNWCLLIIADEKEQRYFTEIIHKSIDRNVGYICAIGQQHDLIHELADEEIVFRDADSDDYHLLDHHIMTTGDLNFENGIWFGLNLTDNNEADINDIVIIDLTKKAYPRIVELILKLENGYLPN